MKRCLITTKKLDTDEINFDQYDLFIGVEYGALYLQTLNLNNVYYVSDFDSLGDKELAKFKELPNSKILPIIRNFVDTEEAIFVAIDLGYKGTAIDLFVNEDLGRKDHLLNVMLLARKHNISIFGNKFEIHAILPDVKTTILKNNFKYLSIFVFEKTEITTTGLKWDLGKRTFTMNSGTNLISNEFIQKAATFYADKKILVILAND